MGLKAARLSFLLFCCFALLAFNLFRMQILKGDYYRSLSEKNRIRVFYLEGPRGKILDRNGLVLASNRLSFNCSVIPREARKHTDRSLGFISTILGVDKEILNERFKKRKPGAYNSILIAEDIDPSKAMAIEEKLDLLPGFVIETRPQREYPLGLDAAHVLGYIGPLTSNESDDLEEYEYSSRDWIGRDGIEKSYESYLKGRSGGLQIEVDSRGRFVRALGVKEPVDGKDVELTVDGKLQSFVLQELNSRKGAVIVMDLKDGGILAMNSSPSFDPNLFASSAGRKDVGKYFNDQASPLINRGISSRYPPGSIFKIVTSLAALEKKKINLNTTFVCNGGLVVGGKLFRCWRKEGHGPQDLVQALAHSCDVYFYKTGQSVGAEAVAAKALQFGLSLKTGIDLPGEKAGVVPSKEWKKKIKHEAWFEGDTTNFAIGQGFLQMTPLEALLMISTVATGGEILKPHFIEKIANVKVTEKQARTINIPGPNLDALRKGLDQVVNSETGTGRLARNADVRVIGKTGTAESGQQEDHAWFVGYAPAQNPKIAMVVFIENGGHGGVVAASLAGNVFKWLRQTGYL